MTRLTIHRLEAIIGALDFVLAGDFDSDCHERPREDYEAARDWADDELCNRQQMASDQQARRRRL